MAVRDAEAERSVGKRTSPSQILDFTREREEEEGREERTARHTPAPRRGRSSQGSSEDELPSEQVRGVEHVDSDSVNGERMEDRRAVEHASMSDGYSDISDDEGFDIRVSQAELADDLEALVQSIAAGNIPDWKEAPDLATDLAQWISHQEVPYRRKPARLALDLSILLGDSRSSETAPLHEPTQMADILRIVKEAAEHTEHAEEHAAIHGNAFGSVPAELFQSGGDHTDTSADWTYGSALGHVPAGLLLGLSYPSNHIGKGKGGGSGSTPSARLPHAPPVPQDVGTSGSACQPL